MLNIAKTNNLDLSLQLIFIERYIFSVIHEYFINR
jgi:hypothetical protein